MFIELTTAGVKDSERIYLNALHIVSVVSGGDEAGSIIVTSDGVGPDGAKYMVRELPSDVVKMAEDALK